MRRDVDIVGHDGGDGPLRAQAFDMVVGGAARKAFDMTQRRSRAARPLRPHAWGQSTLLARRLVEAGSTFVTVHFGGWDHHWDLKSGYENYLPQVDMLVSALFNDLAERGLLRQGAGDAVRRVQPHAADEQRRQRRPGRQHGHARPRPLGQRHVLPDGRRRRQGGRIVGSTNRLGEAPKDRPLECCDIHATIYHVLGIDPNNPLPESRRPAGARHRSRRSDCGVAVGGGCRARLSFGSAADSRTLARCAHLRLRVSSDVRD